MSYKINIKTSDWGDGKVTLHIKTSYSDKAHSVKIREGDNLELDFPNAEIVKGGTIYDDIFNKIREGKLAIKVKEKPNYSEKIGRYMSSNDWNKFRSLSQDIAPGSDTGPIMLCDTYIVYYKDLNRWDSFKSNGKLEGIETINIDQL